MNLAIFGLVPIFGMAQGFGKLFPNFWLKTMARKIGDQNIVEEYSSNLYDVTDKHCQTKIWLTHVSSIVILGPNVLDMA